jgi:uncharacterized protein YyaL (SSP411 family)
VLAGRHWGLDGPPNFEGHHWHLKLAMPVAAADAASFEAARAKLFATRTQRIRPGLDDKILTAWNALMIEGLAHAARICGRTEWLQAARRALEFLKSRRWQDEMPRSGYGRLLATDRLPAYLDDYAFLLAAIVEVMQADFHVADLEFACGIADALLARFEDTEGGGFFFTGHDHEALIHRPKTGHDNALPAGNGVAAYALQRLGHLLGEVRYLEAATRTLQTFWPQLQHHPGGCAALVRALEEALTPPAIVILRGPAAGIADWQVRLVAPPAAIVLGIPNGMTGLPPALAKPETPDVNAWACRGVTCHAPVADFAELQQILKPDDFR